MSELDLHVSWSGCEVSFNQPFAFNFTRSKNNFPPLTSLRLDGYTLGAKVDGDVWREWEVNAILQWPWDKLPKRIIDWVGMERIRDMGGVMDNFVKRDYSEKTPINLDAWLGRMDWSHLKTLKLKTASPEVLHKLAPVLTSLTSFSIEHGRGEAARAFITNAQRPLESISIRNFDRDALDQFILDISVRHGSALKSLTLLGPQLTIFDVAKLREGCPKLEALDIHVERIARSLDNDIWEFDYEFLNGLVSLPLLKHFTIRFESADDTDIRLGRTHDAIDYWNPRKADPLLNRTSVEGLFRNLNGHRQSLILDPLLQLDIFIGDWEIRYESNLINPPMRLLGRWTCKASDGIGKCSGGNIYPHYYGMRGVEEPFSPEDGSFFDAC